MYFTSGISWHDEFQTQRRRKREDRKRHGEKPRSRPIPEFSGQKEKRRVQAKSYFLNVQWIGSNLQYCDTGARENQLFYLF